MAGLAPPPASFLDELFDVGWRTNDRHGARLYRVSRKIDPELLVTFSWAPQYSDGWRRYAFTVIERQPPLKVTVLLIASPEVEISVARGKDSMAPDPVKIVIVRLQRADAVPQGGEPIQIGELMAPEMPVVASAPSQVDSLVRMADVDPGAVQVLSEQTAHVRQNPAGLTVSHHSWQVEVSVRSTIAAGFSVEVMPHPAPGLYLGAPSVFIVRVIRQGDISVVYSQVSDQVALPVVGFPERHSRAEVHILDVDPGVGVPMKGLRPDQARTQAEIEPETLHAPSFESAMFDFATYGTTIASLASIPTGIGTLSAIGTVYDLSELMYATATGRDFAGDDVGTGRYLLMGLFGMMSVVGDLSQDTAKVARGVEGRLFTGTNLVSTSGTFWPALSPYLRRHLSPLLVDAIKRLPDSDASRLLRGIEDSVIDVSRAKVKSLAGLLNDLVRPLIEATPYVDNIPAPLFAHAMKSVDLADTATFELLDGAERLEALANFRRAQAADDPGLLQLNRISPVLSAEYSARILDNVVSRVFTPDLTGFRRAAWGPVTSGLNLGYQTYETGKLLDGILDYRNVLEWALVQAQRGNSRYVPPLVAELGPDIERLLGPLVKADRYKVTATTARYFQSVNGIFGSYKPLRDGAAGLGIGHVLNADHLLEVRFLHTFEGLEGYGQGEFLSLMVPYNNVCVENLRVAFAALGLPPPKVPYTHVLKTSRMQALVPKEIQGKFTVQEIFDAYRLLYVHEFGFGDDLFQGALEHIFLDLFELTKTEARQAGAAARTDVRLAHALNTRALDTTRRTEAELMRSVNRAHNRR